MRAFLKVTQKHINEGKRGEPDGCAVALALKDHGLKVVSVGPYYVGVRYNGVKYRAKASRSLETFIAIFDGVIRKLPNGVKASRKTLRPTTFRLDFAELGKEDTCAYL